MDTSSRFAAPPPAALPEILKSKRIGYPLSDAQILQLVDNLPEGEVHDRWRFAIQLCSVYGLRPEELRYLRIKDGVSGPELWTIYQKSMGGTKGAKTKPRRLHALLVRDADGHVIDWNLQSRLQEGEKLPPLNREGDGSQALNQYLRRRKVWMALRDEAEHQGEELTPTPSGTVTPSNRTRRGFLFQRLPRQWGTALRFI